MRKRIMTTLTAGAAALTLGLAVGCEVETDGGSQKHQPAAEATEEEKASYSVAQEEAIESAESYLEMSGMSREGLIDQLTSEYGDGYKEAVAKFAVDQLDVDWNKEAVESAKSYLNSGSFSRASLIQQLTSDYGDQFTQAQAEQAADKVGL